MFEKVNPMHPDKVADRIAGAMVDLAYKEEESPKVAIEVLIGHKKCFIITESSVEFKQKDVEDIVKRISGRDDFEEIQLIQNKQDSELAKNQNEKIRVGDNGIFKGVPTTSEETALTKFARTVYESYPSDGKYILDSIARKLIVCQSNAGAIDFANEYASSMDLTYILNPLGPWTGGLDTDTGATNRKLGSDMGRCVTGGGLHGKDLSKADVSVNIYAYLKAHELNAPVQYSLAIGDETVDGKPYNEIVRIAKDYIDKIGGFEKFAEWGLVN